MVLVADRVEKRRKKKKRVDGVEEEKKQLRGKNAAASAGREEKRTLLDPEGKRDGTGQVDQKRLFKKCLLIYLPLFLFPSIS